MSRTHDLGEAGDADARHLALLPAGFDILLQLVITELLEGHVHGLGVVATVVDPACRRRVGELLRLDEVLLPELRLVETELEGGVGDQTLDQVAGLGDAERASIRHTTWRLVRVIPIRGDMRRRYVVRARDDVEQPGFEL